MESRGAPTWLVAVLAVAVGFLAALLIFGGGDNNAATVGSDITTSSEIPGATVAPATTTTTTVTTGQQATPATPERSVGTCINLWDQPNNRGNQTFLVNVFSQTPVRVNVRVTTDVPPKCEVTVVTNAGDAYVFPESSGTNFPYAIAPGAVQASTLPADRKTTNALEQSDGTLKSR